MTATARLAFLKAAALDVIAAWASLEDAAQRVAATETAQGWARVRECVAMLDSALGRG